MTNEVTIGTTRVVVLLDGDGDIDPMHECFPSFPVESMAEFRRHWPEVWGEGDAWRLRVRCWLIEHPEGPTLFDTGVGPASAPAFEWYGVEGALVSRLADHGFEPSDVRNVVISHVHDDHIGGTVGVDGRPAFPNARYVIQEADWNWLRDDSQADPGGEGDVMFTRLLYPLEAAGVVDLVSGDGSLADGIGFHHAPGHTPGHQMIRIAAGDERIALTADVFNHPVQVGHPEWASGSDEDPDLGVETRRRILDELAADPTVLVAPTHLAEAFGRIVPGPRGNEWRPEGL